MNDARPRAPGARVALAGGMLACWTLLAATRGVCAFLSLPDGGLLCHPRPEGGDSLPVLPQSSSLLVNGHLGTATAISVNGRPLRCTQDGRFADMTPWPADRLLRIHLDGPGGDHDWDLPLAAPCATPPHAADSAASDVSPWLAPVRVRLDGSPLSTAPGASYWIFPQEGVEWTADLRQDGWLRLPLAPGLAAWVPESRVTLLGAATPGQAEPRLLGPDLRTRHLDNGDLELRLTITGGSPPLWREESDPGGANWRLILEGTRGRLDWVELDSEGGLRQLDWEQLPGEELLLRATLAEGAFQGHHVRWVPGRLLLTFHRRATAIRGARILLDPGHGGSESGCVGASGTLEKDLTLLLARQLRAELERAGAEVRLTRETDSTLSLAGRVAQARDWRADLLLSLHANSVGPGEQPWKADGFWVFSWSPWSIDAARLLHGQLARRLPLRDRGLHWRSLGVCRHHGCPALLLEAGSLVHPGEESLLLDEGFRRRQARAIRKGLEAWFRGGDD